MFAFYIEKKKRAILCIVIVKDAWEKKSKEDGTPLGKFYNSWRKMRDRELNLKISGKEKVGLLCNK